jgi:hypothetical protein
MLYPYGHVLKGMHGPESTLESKVHVAITQHVDADNRNSGSVHSPNKTLPPGMAIMSYGNNVPTQSNLIQNGVRHLNLPRLRSWC